MMDGIYFRPPSPVFLIVKYGQAPSFKLINTSGHKEALFLGDNDEVLRYLVPGSIDYIITSPPYNLRNTDKDKGWGGGSFQALKEGYGNHDDNLPWLDYEAWQATFLRLCWNVLSNRGAIFYVHKPRPAGGEVRLPTIYNPGLPLRQVIIWDRGSGFNASTSHFAPYCEWIQVFAKPNFHLKDRSVSMLGDVWHIPPDSGNSHPAPFPVALPARILSSLTPGVVLDPFCGSGSTLVAAHRLGMFSIGIDNHAPYVEQTISRLQQAILPISFT